MFERPQYNPEKEPPKENDDNPQPSDSPDVDLSGNFIERNRNPNENSDTSTAINVDTANESADTGEKPNLEWSDDDNAFLEEIQYLRDQQKSGMEADADALDSKFKKT